MKRSFQILFLIVLLYLLLEGEASKTYAQMRSDCASKQCKKINKQNKMARDMCIHKCIHKDCYYAIYWDLDRVANKNSNDESDSADRDLRKKDFINCINTQGGQQQQEQPIEEDRDDL